MTKIDLYTTKGVKKEALTLPASFDAEINMRLIAQAMRVYEDGSHVGLAKTKTRAEVNRTTKKLYKQKGTGGARHGSRKAPIFVGGGIAHGPRPLRRILNLSTIVKRKALASALSAKAKDGKLVAISGIGAIKKTNEMKDFIKKVGEELKAKRFTFVLSEKNKEARLKTRNLGNSETFPFTDINAYNIFLGGVVVFDEEILSGSKKVTPKKEVKKVEKAETKKVSKK